MTTRRSFLKACALSGAAAAMSAVFPNAQIGEGPTRKRDLLRVGASRIKAGTLVALNALGEVIAAKAGDNVIGVATGRSSHPLCADIEISSGPYAAFGAGYYMSLKDGGR